MGSNSLAVGLEGDWEVGEKEAGEMEAGEMEVEEVESRGREREILG